MDCTAELRRGNFRGGSAHWTYLGLFCLFTAGLLSASIMGWKLGGELQQSADKQCDAESRGLYVAIPNIGVVDLKALEFGGLILSALCALGCYAMVVR